MLEIAHYKFDTHDYSYHVDPTHSEPDQAAYLIYKDGTPFLSFEGVLPDYEIKHPAMSWLNLVAEAEKSLELRHQLFRQGRCLSLELSKEEALESGIVVLIAHQVRLPNGSKTWIRSGILEDFIPFDWMQTQLRSLRAQHPFAMNATLLRLSRLKLYWQMPLPDLYRAVKLGNLSKTEALGTYEEAFLLGLLTGAPLERQFYPA